MALATRCNSCGTVFRVVQDQLRVSEGWVRCGRCSAVFNATLDLFDLDNGAPVQMQAPAQAPLQPPPQPPMQPAWQAAPPPVSSPGLAPPARRPPPLDNARSDEPGDGPYAGRFATAVDAGADAAVERLGERQSGQPPGMAAEALPPAASLLAPQADDGAAAAIVALAGERPLAAGEPLQVDPDETMVPPSFVRAAERAAFWRQPSVRAGLFGSAVLLALLLAAQAAVTWRDLLAAHLPASRPLLEALCGAAGCSINPLRRIDRLSVDSSGLSRLEGTPLYRLSLVLRSRSDTALLAPALDLALTDSQGRLVARRVLQGAELGLQQPVIAAGQELPLQLTLSVGEHRVTGYTVELFYP